MGPDLWLTPSTLRGFFLFYFLLKKYAQKVFFFLLKKYVQKVFFFCWKRIWGFFFFWEKHTSATVSVYRKSLHLGSATIT